MEIRELVERTGVPAKTFRYYDDINLLPPRQKSQMALEITQKLMWNV